MSPRGPKGYAFNRTRTTYLATDLLIAHTHWSRFRGLMATNSSRFSRGQGLWINPSHGIHTFAMRFPIDAVYLDRERIVIHIEEDLKPWRLAAVGCGDTLIRAGFGKGTTSVVPLSRLDLLALLAPEVCFLRLVAA